MDYDAYIKSAAWKKKRKAKLEAAQNACEHCGKSGWAVKLEVHHKHYRNIGHEGMSELEALCRPCHEKADVIRAAEGRKRSADALEHARFNGWLAAKYGDEDLSQADLEAEAAAFDEWLGGY